jgi:hypothetical protein
MNLLHPRPAEKQSHGLFFFRRTTPQAGGRPVRFQVGRIDHDRLGILPLGGHRSEHLCKHTQSAPSYPSVIKRLRWTIFGGRIPPPQAIAIDEDYSTQNTLVVNARNPVRQWKERLQPLHLRIRQPEKITHAAPPWMPKVNQTIAAKANSLTGPDPKAFELAHHLFA